MIAPKVVVNAGRDAYHARMREARRKMRLTAPQAPTGPRFANDWVQGREREFWGADLYSAARSPIPEAVAPGPEQDWSEFTYFNGDLS